MINLYFLFVFFLARVTMEVVLQGDFNSITDLEKWLGSCTQSLSKSTNVCESAKDGSIIVTISAKTNADLNAEVTNLENNGITILGETYTVESGIVLLLFKKNPL